MEELFSSQCMFYSLNRKYAAYEQSRITFDENITSAEMQKALTDTIQRYPYFKVKLVKKGESYCLEENEKPLILYNDPEHPTMEPDANNAYLLRISAAGCLLNVCFCHALADGRSIMPFIKTLFYYYYRCHYNDDPEIPDVRLAGEEISREEIDDPFLSFDASSIQKPQARPTEQNVLFFGGRGDPEQRLFAHEFTLNSISFMQYAHSIGASPNSLFVIFLYRTLAKIYPERINDIVLTVSVDQRKALGVQNSHHCTVGVITIRYSKEMALLSTEKLNTVIRDRIRTGSDVEVLKPQLAQSKMFAEYIRSKKTLAEKNALCSNVITNAMQSFTGSVSYPGQMNFGKIGSHITAFNLIANSIIPYLSLEILSFDTRFFITLQHGFDDDRIADELKNQIESAGLECCRYEKEVIPNVPFRDMD